MNIQPGLLISYPSLHFAAPSLELQEVGAQGELLLLPRKRSPFGLGGQAAAIAFNALLESQLQGGNTPFARVQDEASGTADGLDLADRHDPGAGVARSEHRKMGS